MARTKSIETVWASGDPGYIETPESATPPVAQATGWTAIKPPFKVFNWFYNLVMTLVQNAEQHGVMEWNSATTYAQGALTKASDNNIYRSIQTANLNKNPTTETAYWTRFRGDGSLTYRPINGNGTGPVTRTITTIGVFDTDLTISAFTGDGVVPADIRALHIFVSCGPNNNTSNTGNYSVGVSATYPDTVLRVLRQETWAGGGAPPAQDGYETTSSGMCIVPINKGQSTITIRAFLNVAQILSGVSWTIVGCSQVEG